MGKHESTAINELIQLAATNGPAVHDPTEDLMFSPPKPPPHVRTSRMTATVPPIRGAGELAPLPRARAPHGTQQQPTLPPIPPVRISTAPPSRAVTVPPLAVPAAPPASTRPARAPLPPPTRTAVVAAPAVLPADEPALITTPPVIAPIFETDEASEVTELAWLEESHAHERLALRLPRDERTSVGVPRRMTTSQWLIKLAPWAGLMIAIGVGIGIYLAIDGRDGEPRDAAAVPTSMAAIPGDEAPTPVAVEPVAAEPVAAEPVAAEPVAAEPVAAELPAVAPAAARPAFVDVRIDSKPTGATVTLIDRGKSIYLGTTPLRTAVDPSRRYELELTHARREPQREVFDPKASTRLSIVLEKRPRTTARPAVVAPRVASPAFAPSPAKAAAPARAEAPATVPAPAKAEAPARAVAPAGNGILMLSSKPPCEIYVDGKATGLTTPQRALELSAGKHRITLVNTQQNVKKTFSVDISPDRPTKAIHDLMSK